jgi:hypothetical protein
LIRTLSFLVMLAAACSFDSGRVGPSGTPDAAQPEVDGGGAIDAAGADAQLIDSAPPDACAPDPAGERCNGLDDDCDGETDEDFPALGTPCDGPDTDQCEDDPIVCNVAGDGTECDPAPGDDDVESCNGMDDDCDGQFDEDFPTLGDTCDGPDTDQCEDDQIVCNAAGSGTACSTGDDDVELCNGDDDDCDGQTDEDFPTLGMPCDGSDQDQCVEGELVCNALGGIVCDDTTGDDLEECNGADDDCDGQIDEDFDLDTDEANCGACGTVCQLTNASSTECIGGDCDPTCVAGATDCDGDPDAGCEVRNTNPACSGFGNLGTVNGDSNMGNTATTTGTNEAWFTLRVSEIVAGNNDPDARITLSSPAGNDFDLFVYCEACGNVPIASSTNGAGLDDVVNVGNVDISGQNNAFDVLIEVRWVSTTTCAGWTLSVLGNQGAYTGTCTP